ncbi:MAG TPA: alpha/beta fold hydrolase [Candidatus Eisenbacteria bacterium]|jgi:pimeloyl-ACP methyl ester carboxylesterase
MRAIGRALGICALAACAGGAAPTRAPDGSLAGTWRGSAVFQGARLDLSIRFSQEGGTLRAAMSSPELLMLEQPLAGVESAGRQVRFVTTDDHPLRFEGEVNGDSLRGTAVVPAVPGVVEAGGTAPPLRFSLGRARAPDLPPYSAHEVRFASGRARLAGTVYVPDAGPAPRAGIVLLQGSSTNLRSDYRFYADHFARAGLAVLAFDKRGAGESSGDYGAATYDTLAGDAAAAVECLRATRGVDAQRVGVWGLSQGAFISPLVAARVPSLRFIVAISAPGMPIGESAAYQDSMRLASAGFDAADIQRTVSLDRRLQAWLGTRRDSNELSALLAEAATTPWRRASSLPERLPSGAALAGWYWRGRTLDPAPWWRAVRVPVLAVYGAADELVPAKPSARLVEHALRQGGNRDVTVRVFPAANHVLRTLPLVAGGRWDWPRAAPGYLESVTSWVLERSGPGASPRHR